VGDTRIGSTCCCRCCRAARAFDVGELGVAALVTEVMRRVNSSPLAVTFLPLPGRRRVIGRQFTLDTLAAIAEARGDSATPDPTDREFVTRAARILRPTAPIASGMAVKAVLIALAEMRAASGTAA
jgi:hypothetical protein